MVVVVSRRCAHDFCATRPTYNVQGSKTAAYCKPHAVDGMVDVVNKRCSHDSCGRRPTFNVEGSRTAVYCKQHATDGMVSIWPKSFARHVLPTEFQYQGQQVGGVLQAAC